jgi:hypothetical protein
MAKARSPNYPSASLGDAIKKTHAIYQKDYRSKMARVAVAKHLGYNSINGASLTAISNLVKYGLLDGRGDDMQVTNDAVTILAEPEGSPDRQEALRRAAFRPALFAQLHKQFGESMPSAENLNAYLQRNGFNPSASSAAARAYRETFQLVSRPSEAYTPAVEKKVASESVKVQDDVTAELVEQGADPEREVLMQRVAKDCVARVAFQGKVTQQAIDKLCAILGLMKDTYPQEDPA